MITVNCKDILPIQHELLVHVADHLKAIPAVKHTEFILSPIEHDDKIDNRQVSKIIQNYLVSIGEASNFSVIVNPNKISINYKKKKKINRKTLPVKTMRSCCGL